MEIQSLKIGVCGAGTMGSGIALTCAMHGFEVILFDRDISVIAAAKNKIASDLQLFIAKNKISAEDNIIQKIQFTSSIGDCMADLIIEAIIEKAEVKAGLFNHLAAFNASSTIFATNTSSLSVTAIAEQFSKPEQLAGMHFFNPATIMKLIEVVKTKYSSEKTIGTITRLANSIGKTTVLCKDAPGFIVNRVARPYYLEALYLVEKFKSGVQSIDELMESSGFKMGPFRLMDLIGNDINYSVSSIVYDALGKPERLRPSPIQEEKVASGHLGRKTGRGYYEYTK
jgi:3-hydroxybutyryl-CoA dehydrogenase